MFYLDKPRPKPCQLVRDFVVKCLISFKSRCSKGKVYCFNVIKYVYNFPGFKDIFIRPYGIRLKTKTQN